MNHKNKKLKDIRFYKNTQYLDTSSYLNFTKSVFKEVPKWFWIYIIFISIAGAYLVKDASFFVPESPIPEDRYPINVYTFLVMILLPIPLTYIRFIKSFSFTKFYIGLANLERDYVKKFNKDAKEEADKVYNTDRYSFSYDKRSKTWSGKNIDAEERFRKRHGIEDASWFIKMLYPGFLVFFLMIYIFILYHIIIIVALLVALHIFYKYKQIKRKRYQ